MGEINIQADFNWRQFELIENCEMQGTILSMLVGEITHADINVIEKMIQQI